MTLTLLLVYGTVFIAALISAEVLLRGYFTTAARHKAVNHRLSLLDGSVDHRKTYRDMLKERGADQDWRSLPLMQRLRRFYAQSGIKFDAPRFALYAVAGGALLLLPVTIPPGESWRFGRIGAVECSGQPAHRRGSNDRGRSGLRRVERAGLT